MSSSDTPGNGQQSAPFLGLNDPSHDVRNVSVSVEKPTLRPRRLVPKPARRAKNHTQNRVAFFHYSHYDLAFRYFTKYVLDAEFVELPSATRQTLDLGTRNSSDYVCAPFKHMMGDYIEALERGANVLVQFAGPCRLGYYGELQESILRDLGYEFTMLNFAELSNSSPLDYVKQVKAKINPNVSVPTALLHLATTAKMVTFLDEAYDRYLERAAFAVEKGAFKRELKRYHAALKRVSNDEELVDAQNAVLAAFEAIPVNIPANRVRVGIVGEFYTAVDQHSNLEIEEKLIGMGVELHRLVNLNNRFLHYDEKALRREAGDYLTYDMGPTSSMTCAAAVRYARAGYDGIVHLKSSGCTPEIDCVPVLRRISSDFHIPVLYLSYDSQTSDTGLDTRLEAFYDMLAMKKEKGK
jgi:predicted nucleotide-binding protein (sugar kinase/HSP70/actin superfamily)